MRALSRLGLVVAMLAAPHLAEAAPIIVAEFRWDAELFDPGVACDPADAACVAVDPTHFSVYSLTGLWDGAPPEPTLTGTLTLGTGATFDWLSIPSAAGFDQLAFTDLLPATAFTTILFDFGGETRSLSALLGAPGSATLSFDPDAAAAPIPEPGTLTLFGAGLASLIRSAVRRRNRRHN
jgi:hypothetical protein